MDQLGTAADSTQGEKIAIKEEPASNTSLPDEPMHDVTTERRLPPKKMKVLEERNGGATSDSPAQKTEGELMKRSREDESSEKKSLEEGRSSGRHASDDEEGPRIRVRATTKKASFEGHFAEDSDDDEERIRLQQIFELDQNAAIEAGMDIDKMTKLERQELPASARHPNRYLEIRNHILRLWVSNRKDYLSKEAALRPIQKKYIKEAGEIHTFLTRFGFINIGHLANRPTMEAKESVIIIGAGMAGIAAAFHLHTQGYRVKVLEGRDRVGGRCSTTWSGSQGMGVDMGAMVVTGKQGNPVTVFAEQLSIKMHRLSANCPIYDHEGKPVPPELDESVEKKFNDLLTEAARSQGFTSLGKAIDSLVDMLKPTDLSLSLFNWHFANLEYGCAAELALVDLHHWDQDDQYELGGGHYLLPTGYGSIVKGLARTMDVRLSHPVQKISHNEEGVEVTCDNGSSFKADYAICSVPLGILKANKITFEPPLPEEKQTSVQKLGFGLLNKMALYFERSFWSPNEDYFGITSIDPERRGENFLFWNMQRTTGMPVLLALIAGKAAKFIEDEKDEDIVARSLKALRSVFGDLPHLDRFQVTRWQADPFSNGSYSYIAEGTTGEEYDILARPLGRLRFAGEATCREHPATVVGACLSGLREAGFVDCVCRGPIQESKGIQEDGSEETPANRRRRLRLSDPNMPSFRKRNSTAGAPDEAPKPDEGVTSPRVYAPLYMLPRADPLANLAATEERKVDVDSIRRDIQNQPPPRHPSQSPAAAPSPAMSLHIGSPQPFRPSPAGAPFGAHSGAPLTGHAHGLVRQSTHVMPVASDAMVISPVHAAVSANGSGKKFREELSEMVVKRLHNRYMTQGRIATKEDFKHLARKLTHIIVDKEQKKQNLSEPVLTEDVRKKAKRFIDDFFANQPMPYHSDKTGVLLPDPLVQSREARKKEKQRAHHDKKHKQDKHKHHKKQRSHHEPKSGGENGKGEKRTASPEPEAPPMSPVDVGSVPVNALAPVALPSGFVPMTITEPATENV